MCFTARASQDVGLRSILFAFAGIFCRCALHGFAAIQYLCSGPVCRWVQDIEGSMSDGKKIQYPIIADPDRSIAKQWGAAAAAAVASLLLASSMASL